MKKRMTSVIASIMTLAMATTSFAAGWQKNATGWWWQNTDGSWPSNGWVWLDGNGDGTAECYYFDRNGYLLVNTVTPDGYLVNDGGAWVVNNVVQTKQLGPGNSPSTAPSVSYPTTRSSSSGSSSSSTSKDGWYGSRYRQNGSYLKNTWKTIDGDRYYFDSNGYALTGFHTIGSKTYYFNSDGSLRKRSFSRDGYYYEVNSSGVITDVIDEDEALEELEFYADFFSAFE